MRIIFGRMKPAKKRNTFRNMKSLIRRTRTVRIVITNKPTSTSFFLPNRSLRGKNISDPMTIPI